MSRTASLPHPQLLPFRAEVVALSLILLAALGLRLYRLDEVPPGLTHDEAGHGHDAASVLAGYRPIYFTVGYGREPLFDYFNAAVFALAGPSILALRGSAVFWGMVAIAATYLWARRACGARAALVTAALMAVSFWPLAVSRQGLRSGVLPGLFALTAWVWWGHFKNPKEQRSKSKGMNWAGWGVFTLLMAATLYTYLPARGLWIVFPVFVIYLAIFHRSRASRPAGAPTAGQTPISNLQSPTPSRPEGAPTESPISNLQSLLTTYPLPLTTLLSLLLAFLLFLPLLLYLRAHPGAEQRLTMLDAPLQAAARGDFTPILGNARDALLMFFWPGAGDHFLAYNVPGRPIFDPLTFAAFAVGLALCARRWRDPAHAFALVWFAVGIGPSILTGAEAATTRSLAAMPMVYLFPALAIDEILNRWAAGKRRRLVIVAVMVSATAILASRDYFVRWAASPDVRAAYQHTLIEAMRYLDSQAAGGTVVISTVYPNAAHDPYIAELALRRKDVELRWADGREAMIFPGDATTRWIVPASTPLDPTFGDMILRAGATSRVNLWPDDLDPYFDVSTRAVNRAELAERIVTAETALADGASLPANFNNAVELFGYEGLAEPAASGDTVRLVTYWRVLDPERVGPKVLPAFKTDAAMFVHVLDADSQIVAQQDRLDAPSWDWQAGDVIAQIFRLALPADLPPGEYSVEAGVYNRADGARLPVVGENGAMLGERVEFRSLAITSH